MGKTRKVGKIKKILLESEYDNSRAWENMQDIKRMTYSMKCFILIGCLIIFISSFSGLMTIVGGAPVDYNYTFENDYLFDGSLPDALNTYNIRNITVGHYPATYSFENDVNGSNPIGFITTESSSDKVSVLDNFEGHSKVVKIVGSASGHNYIEQYFTSGQEIGTIEFWINHVDLGADEIYMDIYGNAERVSLLIQFGVLYAFNNMTQTSILNPFPSGWNHIYINFSMNTYDVFVNSSLKANDFLIRSDENPNSFTYLKIMIPSWRYANIAYIDAIGYSWDVQGYKETYFNVNVQDGHAFGIAWDGTYFNVVGNDNTEIYQYSALGVYTGTHFDVGVQDTLPIGICWDGTYFYVTGEEHSKVYRYTSAGVYTGFSFNIGTQDIFPISITWDGTYFYVLGEVNQEIYQYSALGVYTGTHWDVYAQDIYCTGISWDGTYFNVVGKENDAVYRYSALGVYTGIHWDVGVQVPVPVGIGYAGRYSWVVGFPSSGVYKYYFGDNYTIGDNRWITEMIPTNEREVDKFEFVSNSTGDFYEEGISVVEGWNISENANGKAEIKADDEGFDKVVTFYIIGAYGHSEMNKTLETYNSNDYIEISINGSVEGRTLTTGSHEFFINCTDIDGLTVFSLKLITTLKSTWILLYNKTAPYYYWYDGYYTMIGLNHEDYSGTVDFDFNLNLIFYNGSIQVNYTDDVSHYYHVYNSDFSISGNCVKKILFINDYLISGHIYSADVNIDNVGIYINGESISTEAYPENIFFLTNLGVSLLEFNLLEITFNYDFVDNNLSIYINDVIHIIDYNQVYNNGYFRNLYSDTDLMGFYLRIYNSSNIDIINIKVYGVKLIDDYSGVKYPLIFDYSSVDINDSYFHVDSSNRLSYILNTGDTNLEYISANFDITNVPAMNRSISFSHRKSNALAFSEFRVLYTDTSYSIFHSTTSTKTVNSILPQNKVIASFYFLITDDDNDLNTTLTGYLSSITLIYYPDIETTIGTLSLLGIIPLLFLLVFIPFLMYMKFKNAIVVIPTFILMTIVGITTGLLPNWVGVVLIIGSIFTYLIKKEVME